MSHETLSDAEFLRRFEHRHLRPFTHVDHIRVAYLYALRGGATEAVSGARGIRLLAAAAGVPEKFHETMTVAWARVIAHLVARTATPGFSEFLAEHPMLLDRRLLSAHYSDELLFSARARERFVEPDLVPFP